MGEQKGNVHQRSNVSIYRLTLVSRSEGTHQHRHRLPHPQGRRPHHQAGSTNLHRPQEISPLRHDQRPLSTFHPRHVRHCRGLGRTWSRTTHNLCHRHPRIMSLHSSSRRFLQADLALKRQRKMFVVDTLTSSNNKPRHHLHHHRRLLYFP